MLMEIYCGFGAIPVFHLRFILVATLTVMNMLVADSASGATFAVGCMHGLYYEHWEPAALEGSKTAQ